MCYTSCNYVVIYVMNIIPFVKVTCHFVMSYCNNITKVSAI